MRVTVVLISGARAELEADPEEEVRSLLPRVRKALGKPVVWLVAPNAERIPEDCLVGALDLAEGAVLTAVVPGLPHLVASSGAFCALLSDGSVVAWGEARAGGNTQRVASKLESNVRQIQAGHHWFLAVKDDGSQVLWGGPAGDDGEVCFWAALPGFVRPEHVAEAIDGNVRHAAGTFRSFAVVTGEGAVATWGAPLHGGDCQAAQGQLRSGVLTVAATSGAFAGLKDDGSVVCWGSHDAGGQPPPEVWRAHLAGGVRSVVATATAFAAIKADGSVVCWGDPKGGGDLATVCQSALDTPLLDNVVDVVSSKAAFAALRRDGSVVCWGSPEAGGDASAVKRLLLGGVVEIYCHGKEATAFAALKADGTVVSWGDKASGGDSRSVQRELRNVRSLTASKRAFAALREDGSVVTWGHLRCGGDSQAVAEQLTGVASVVATETAFAALKQEGSVVVWGDPGTGGYRSSAVDRLDRVVEVKATQGAFCALRADGSVVVWGHLAMGGSALEVPAQLQCPSC